MSPWASIRRDCVIRLISSRMCVISLGGTTASWGYGPGGVEIRPIDVSLSRKTSLTMLAHDRSASVPRSDASLGLSRWADLRSPSRAPWLTAPLRLASSLVGS
jgi:hypothetical protein